MSERDRLIGARDRLAKGFCKNVLALDAFGKQIDSRSQDARQWCVLGALISSSLDVPQPLEHDEVARRILPHLPEEWRHKALNPMATLVYYNNDPATTQADIVWLLDKTIAALPG